MAELWELFEEPGFGFVNGRDDFRSSVFAVEEAAEGEGGAAGPEGKMGVWDGGVNIEPFGPRRTSPRTVFVLLADEVSDTSLDRCFKFTYLKGLDLWQGAECRKLLCRDGQDGHEDHGKEGGKTHGGLIGFVRNEDDLIDFEPF
jgi:hypothetical protein